jgi:enoyl-CoA hydratase/carnithine racemase
VDYEYLQVEQEGPAAVVTLNRPEKRNALSLEMMLELIYVLQTLGSDAKVRAIIIAAAGKVFCSGHDLSQMVNRSEEDYRKLFETCSDLMLKIESTPQPVIAQVHGVATAAGCQLVAACDLAVATDDAQFATPGVKIGLFCSTPMVPLTRAVGRKRAMQMLLTGDAIDAQTAVEWGLINRAVPRDELKSATRELAAKIAGSSPYVVAVGKKAFYAQIDADEKTAYCQVKAVMTNNAMAADAQEGISAFLAKRTPVWCGK